MAELVIIEGDLAPQPPSTAFSNGEHPQLWVFDAQGFPWCVNGCGRMVLSALGMPRGGVVAEAIATCPVCRHQMLVAQEEARIDGR